MRRFIVGIFATLGCITFIFLIVLGWSLYRLTTPASSLSDAKDAVVLTLSLGEEDLPEQPLRGGLRAYLEGNPLSVYDVVKGIEAASKDKQVKGILLTINGNALKMASTQEIREAFKVFKATGKFIYTYTDTFGELSNGTLAYYLASASTKIWMMPLGNFNITGMMIEVPFSKKALENFKIHPQLGRREEYKGAVESITEEDFTPPYRKNIQRIMDTFITQITADVAAERGLAIPEVKKIMDTAPYLPQEAVEQKMIDAVGYKDQVKEAIEKDMKEKPAFYSLGSYLQTLKDPHKGEQIAIVYAEGMITKDKRPLSPLSDDKAMDATEVAKSIREAAEDKNIKAIILRIDSGGGSPLASELISHEMDKAKSIKPVIVSMSNYAASGGYWIACNAHKIVAQPATLTGSIGVFAGKIVTQGFWEHYGVHWGEVHSGENAVIWSTGQDFSEKGWGKINNYLDKIYDTFLDKVAKGRRLDPEKVRFLAKGQVWTGNEAKENGLVDALGGLTTAITLAIKEANLPEDTSPVLKHLPEQKSFADLLLGHTRQGKDGDILARYPSLRILLQSMEEIFTPPQVHLKGAEIRY